MFSIFVVPASAAGTIIAFSNNTITIGDKVVVTVTVDAGVPMYAVGYKLVYDSTKLSYEGSAGSIKVVESPTGDTKFVKQFTFTSLAVGNAAIKVEECNYAGIDLKENELNGASASLTIKDVALSNNANLKSLSVSTGTLSPAFSAARTNYTVSVPYEAANITLYATTSDAKAKVAISSNPTNLNVGANNIKVTVTAQDGSQKIYTVVVTRREQGATQEPDITPPPTNTNPYETVISGKNYEIVTAIPETAYLKGFDLSSEEYNGKAVPVLREKDNNFVVYYLKESGTTDIAPYTYNSELETFEALKYITVNNNIYIFTDFPDGEGMSDDYYSTYTQVGDFSVKSYVDSRSAMSDFAYVYCFANGKYGLYRYDTKEGTIQRYPDTHLVAAPDLKEEESNSDTIISGFSSLSTNGKILLIGMLIAAICIVVLVVLIIIMVVRKSKEKKSLALDYDDVNYIFDDVTIVGDNDISSNSK